MQAWVPILLKASLKCKLVLSADSMHLSLEDKCFKQAADSLEFGAWLSDRFIKSIAGCLPLWPCLPCWFTLTSPNHHSAGAQPRNKQTAIQRAGHAGHTGAGGGLQSWLLPEGATGHRLACQTPFLSDGFLGFFGARSPGVPLT